MKTKWTMTSLLLSCVFATVAQAGKAENKGGWMDKRLERLEQRLNLTPEQTPKVETILKEQREKFRAVRQETHRRLKEVLTADQWEKFQAMHQNRMERKRQGGPRHPKYQP